MIKKCQGCNKDFEARGPRLYCDDCLTKTCIFCGRTYKLKAYRPTSRFCSPACYHKGQETGLTDHAGRTFIEFICKNCGKKFNVEKRRYGTKSNPRIPKFCSRDCWIEWNRRPKKRCRGKRCRGKEWIRQREKKNSACIICGFNRFVEIAHIIPAIKGGGYDAVNILYLCPNHHRLFDENLLFDEEFQLIKEKIQKALDFYNIKERPDIRNRHADGIPDNQLNLF